MKWYEQIEHNLIMAKKIKPIGNSNVFAFSLADMQTAFIILMIGLMLSILVFLYEHLTQCRIDLQWTFYVFKYLE